MKHRGDNAPANAFTMEEQPNKPGFVLVRFYENVHAFEETSGEQTTSGYEYDEYHLELPDSVTEQEITDSLSAYLAEAKEQEVGTEAALRKRVKDLIQENSELLSQVAKLDGQLTDTQLALCDVFEIVYGGA